jgi:small-conductance mechanosensitive channel
MTNEPLGLLLRQWMTPLVSGAVALVAAVIVFRAGVSVLRRLTRGRPAAGLFVRAATDPGLAVVALMAVQTVLESAPDALEGMRSVRHVTMLLVVAAATWLTVRLIACIADAVALRFPIDVADNLRARRIQTQTRLLTRALSSLALLVGIASALLTFPGVRNLGASLLASAGIAGLVVGIAARPILGNLLAGLQIALTQPIRIDDVVVVEGEWGRIEEIGAAYVVVAIWDQRRLVLPLQYFIEKPFENWTHATSELLGTVFLWVDYGMPVDPLREELRRICEASPDWDRRIAQIEVTEAGERAVQLRVLVSAADASRAWDLRCHVRERLIDYVRREHPQFLPRLRAELEGGSPAGDARPR